jgi:hypothetical protein
MLINFSKPARESSTPESKWSSGGFSCVRCRSNLSILTRWHLGNQTQKADNNRKITLLSLASAASWMEKGKYRIDLGGQLCSALPSLLLPRALSLIHRSADLPPSSPSPWKTVAATRMLVPFVDFSLSLIHVMDYRIAV